MNFFYNPSTWKGISLSIYLVFSLFLSYSIQAQDNIRNSRPTLNRIPDYSTRFSTDLHFIELNGISAGEETEQQVTIAVTTRDKDLIESVEADVVDNGKAFIYYRLKEGTTGTATVKVVVTDNGETPSSISQTFHITSEALNRELPTIPLLQEANNHHLKAFPNPAVRSTRIYFSTPEDVPNAAVDMYTLSGIKIKQLFTGSTLGRESYYVDVDSRNLATGVYIVRLTGPSHAANLKLVVAR
ncbi:MAG TPA: T9SS type A sorting domain-containing protein [Flavitalea sp.]|nr:T9SS type A sorting domain-containing protein [Flavitalea sp.]